jgi:hypothetical protein
MDIIKGKQQRAWKGLIYGVPGIGKSSFAALAPKPLFLDIEDGIARIDADKTPLLKNYDEFLQALRWAYDSEYQTIVIDTMDYLENHIHNHLCIVNNWKNIEQPGFGKGYAIAQEEWFKLMHIFDNFVAAGKNILLVGHDQIKSYVSPDQDAYDRYLIKLNQKSAALVVAKMDFVFFAQFETILKEDRVKDDRLRAVGTGKRVLRTCETPAWIAKNRFGLTPSIPMDDKIFASLK